MDDLADAVTLMHGPNPPWGVCLNLVASVVEPCSAESCVACLRRYVLWPRIDQKTCLKVLTMHFYLAMIMTLCLAGTA